MNPAVTHPLVSAYLRDLELLLHGLDPGERAEVLAGVHEHLEMTLPPDAPDDDVRRTLAELGSPQSVADEAYAGRPPLAHPVTVADRTGPMSRTWVPIVVALLLGLALCFVLLVTLGASGYSSGGMETTRGPGGEVVTEEVVEFSAAPSALLAALMLTWPLLVPAAIIVGASPLWSGREKWALQLLVPISALLAWALPTLGWLVTRREVGINVGAWAGLALALLGGGYLLIRLCRTGAARTRALAARAIQRT